MEWEGTLRLEDAASAGKHMVCVEGMLWCHVTTTQLLQHLPPIMSVCD